MKVRTKIRHFLIDHLVILILGFVALLCALFIICGEPSKNGNITLDGGDAVITDSTKQFIEDSQEALNRIMNQDKPTDADIEKEFEDGFEGDEGLGGATTIDTVISRRRPDGDNDNGRGWQCSKYTAYLATGKKDYSSVHPDYGPVNGKNVAEWLHKNFGWKYIDRPVQGAIGSGGFNTLYGHTAMYLYSTGDHTAMVNDANYVPLTVATHNMNIDGWVWVVPGDYTPDIKPEPAPAQNKEVDYVYVPGDYFSKVLIKLGLDENNLWGENGTVKYYTRQLIEQNMLDAKGNVKLGVKFKLTKK